MRYQGGHRHGCRAQVDAGRVAAPAESCELFSCLETQVRTGTGKSLQNANQPAKFRRLVTRAARSGHSRFSEKCSSRFVSGSTWARLSPPESAGRLTVCPTRTTGAQRKKRKQRAFVRRRRRPAPAGAVHRRAGALARPGARCAPRSVTADPSGLGCPAVETQQADTGGASRPGPADAGGASRWSRVVRDRDRNSIKN